MVSLREERKLWKRGFKKVVGLDEAGRGALAGPVVAAAVMINSKFEYRNSKQFSKFECFNTPNGLENWKIGELGFVSNFGFRALDLKLRDSKKLSPKQREKIYKLLLDHPAIEWGIGEVSEKVIDKINILEATKLAMKRAIKKIQNSKFEIQNDNSKSKIDYLILDGNFKLDLPIPQKSIVKADEKIFSSALASIIAKVTRDRIMKRYHQKYPRYGFAKNNGYPTRFHRKMLKKYGPCKIHRKSFRLL